MSGTELSTGDKLGAMRTELSFQRTRLAADRTLMASLRTALSLIGFGFTIFSFFRTLAKQELLGGAIPPLAPARFGLSLVVLGVLLLATAIWSELKFIRSLRAQRDEMVAAGMLDGRAPYPHSLSIAAAFLLLLVGLFALLSIIMRAGPFQ